MHTVQSGPWMQPTHYVIDPVLGGSAKPDFETLFVLFGMVEVYSEVINAHLHVIRAQRLR